MDDSERMELLLDALERLKEKSQSCTILVEGAKDVRALKNLGIEGDLICVQSSGGPLKAAETVWRCGKGAVILTDWDRRGTSLAKQLRESLESLCVDYDDSIRKDMSRAVRPYSKDAESLDSVFALLEKKTGQQLNP